jgi:hypothetical protein
MPTIRQTSAMMSRDESVVQSGIPDVDVVALVGWTPLIVMDTIVRMMPSRNQMLWSGLLIS